MKRKKFVADEVDDTNFEMDKVDETEEIEIQASVSEPSEPGYCPWCKEEGLLLTELNGFTAYSCEYENCNFDQWTIRWSAG